MVRGGEFKKLSPNGYCSDWRYPNTGSTGASQSGGYDTESSTAEECMKRCEAKIPGTTSFYLRGNNCGCSVTMSGACPISPSANYVSFQITRSGPAPPMPYKKIGTTQGYCTDWRFPNTGSTAASQSGGYDSESSTAEDCMKRCQAKIPSTTSFYLRGTNCGCSATKTGACAVTPSANYVSFEIKEPATATPAPSTTPATSAQTTFKKIGTTNGYCKDWLYPNTGSTPASQSGGYDTESSTAVACKQRCEAKVAGTTSFYLRGTNCGCSSTTSGACVVQASANYESYEIIPATTPAPSAAPATAMESFGKSAKNGFWGQNGGGNGVCNSYIGTKTFEQCAQACLDYTQRVCGGFEVYAPNGASSGGCYIFTEKSEAALEAANCPWTAHTDCKYYTRKAPAS